MADAHKTFRMSASARRRSIKYAFINVTVLVIGGTCISPSVLSLFALKLGAGEVFLGGLSFAILTPLAFSLFTLPTIEHKGKRSVMLKWYSIATIFLLPLLMLPGLAQVWPSQYCLAALLLSMFAMVSCRALGFTGWFPILQDIIPPRLTGRFFANLRTSWQTCVLITLFVVAWFLGDDPQWWKFRLLFAVAVFTFLVRVFTIIPMTENPPLKTRENRSTVTSIIKDFFQQKSGRSLFAYIITYAVAFGISVPFKIKLLKDLSYSEGFILTAVAMMNLGAIVSLRFWGKLADRFGNRFIFGITHIAMIATTLLWIFVRKDTFGTVLVFLLYLLGSIFNSGNGIAQTRYILHAIPSHKQSHVSLVNTAVFTTWGIAPLLGGLLLSLTQDLHLTLGTFEFGNYQLLFVITAALFLLPHFLRLRLKLAKDTPTPQVLVFVLRPLINLLGPFIRIGRKENR